jgi:hypothetical protein
MKHRSENGNISENQYRESVNMAKYGVIISSWLMNAEWAKISEAIAECVKAGGAIWRQRMASM